MHSPRAEEIARKLTKAQRGALLMYRPETYAISLGRELARPMEKIGVLDWVPGCFGGIDWRITDLGREVASLLAGDETK